MINLKKIKKEIIIEWKGYVIRKIDGPYFIAIPEKAKCFVHRKERGECDENAIFNMRQLINSEIKL